MFICLCFGLSEKKLRELAEQSGNCLDTLQSKCGAGSSCGSCIEDIKKVLSQNEGQQETPAQQDLGKKSD